MERNAALKQPFRLEENSDAGLLSCQYVTGPCLYQQKCPAPTHLILSPTYTFHIKLLTLFQTSAFLNLQEPVVNFSI